MLRALVEGSVRHAKAVVALAVLVLGLAVAAATRLPVDVFPDLEGTQVTVLTEAPGFATDEVERLVTIPVERTLLGTRGVRRVRSSSVSGLSLVWVEYEDDTQIERARQRVAERLAIVGRDLPSGVVPMLGPEASLTGEILQVAVTSPGGDLDPLALRGWAEFELRPRLLAVAGVAQVSAMGGRLPEVLVEARQERLRSFDLSLVELAEAVRDAHSSLSSGYLSNDAGLEVGVRQDSRVAVVEDLADAVVRDAGPRPIRLEEVADVRLAGAPRRGSAALVLPGEAARTAVVLGVTKAPGTNTLEVTRRIDETLARIPVPGGVEIHAEFARHASFIERAVQRVEAVALEAAIIVSLVLLLFLFDLRTSFIALCAIPLALAITAIWLVGSGGGIDVMTLGGMAIAIGVLVDDAIIDVENVLRRLRGNAALPAAERAPVPQVVVRATSEIRPAMVQATLILVLAFLPLLTLEGLEGKFFRPLGSTFVVALLASLAVALTVTPALCRLLLARARPSANPGGHGPMAHLLLRLFRPLLDGALRFRGLTLFGALLLVVAAAFLASRLGTSFLPRFHEGMATIFVFAPPGTSLDESEALATTVAEAVATTPGVAAIARRTGRAERDEHVEPVWNSELEVTFLDPERAEGVSRAIRARLEGLPGITTSQGQPIEHRLSHVLSGTSADLAIEVYEEDRERVAVASASIARALQRVPGTRDVDAQRTLTVEGVAVEWDRSALARLGATVADVAGQLRAAIQGTVVGRIVEGTSRTDLVVRLAADERRSAGDVGDVQLVTPRRARVRVSDLSAIEIEDTPALLLRQDGRRKGVVTCNVAERANLGDVVEAAREALEPIARAGQIEIEFGGQVEAAARGRRRLFLSSAVVAVVALLLLRSTVRSWVAAFLVALNLPLAAAGGVFALFLTGERPLANLAALARSGDDFVAPVVSLSTLVGFAALFGIALRGGVLLAGRWEALVADGLSVEEAIRAGVEDRLVPILMTALTAALGLLPVALNAGQPGTELLAPLAVVVLGGLASSTLLNLLVLPAAYALARGPGTESTRPL